MYRVVVIEDHPLVGSAVQLILEAQGHFQVVATRESGVAGLAAVREMNPDLVILDLSVPLLGGIEVIERLRKDSSPARILVLSGSDEISAALRALRAGANGFVHKSSDLSELSMAALLVARGKGYFSHEVLELAAGSKGTNVHDLLTAKEYEVFQGLVAGQSNGDISKHMLLSNKTVSAYKIKIMRKLGAKNIRELIEFARQ
ncbi:response regulator [Lysobacter sp. GCM10012299]|uniref:response regulator n=1 Tax=Lysobacter sp. GCM10012299 TaxID=3317333 RepID=UPI003612CEB2